MDKVVPELMGVSKPILDDVVIHSAWYLYNFQKIFCHQEESNWPMQSQGAKLKQKFDDIFAATRYTKALEAVKKLKKTHAEQVKDAQLKLETVETNRNHAIQVSLQTKS